MNIFRNGGIQENNNERRNIFNLNRRHYYVVSLIFVILAIIMYQYSSTPESIKFTFDEFIKYISKLGYGPDIFGLPTSEEINKNIVNCTSLAHKIEQSVAFNNTGPQLVVNLNEFSSKLEIAKSSYTKMYSEGVYFIWNFEQFINNTLNYISYGSLMPIINRETGNSLQSSIKGSIEALNKFISSVDKAHDATLTAESFRSGTHKQVTKARNELQHFIYNTQNPSFIKRIFNFIGSITDPKEINALKVDYNIAMEIDSLLGYLDSDLKGIQKILLNFKENLEEHASLLYKLEAGIEPLKQLKCNEYEIKKIREILNMVKENHKNFKSRSRPSN